MREVYEVDAEHLLLVASDRVSAFDVVMREPIPHKGAVLTQISAFWFERLADVFPSHYITARTPTRSSTRVPALADARERDRGPRHAGAPDRAGALRVRGARLSRRARPGRSTATAARWPASRCRRDWSKATRLDPPLFSPATKAETGHDENITFDADGRGARPRARRAAPGRELRHLPGRPRPRRASAASSSPTPSSSSARDLHGDAAPDRRGADARLARASGRPTGTQPGRAQPSFDKQPLRDYLGFAQGGGRWNGEAPPPPLPAEVVEATSRRYLEAFRLLTGRELEVAP